MSCNIFVAWHLYLGARVRRKFTDYRQMTKEKEMVLESISSSPHDLWARKVNVIEIHLLHWKNFEWVKRNKMLFEKQIFIDEDWTGKQA